MNPANDPSLRVLIESAYPPSDRYTRTMERQCRDLIDLCQKQTEELDCQRVSIAGLRKRLEQVHAQLNRQKRRADIAWQACFICALLFAVALVYIAVKWWSVWAERVGS